MPRAVLSCLGLLAFISTVTADTHPTNIVYMMADELGHYEPRTRATPTSRTVQKCVPHKSFHER